MLKHFDGQSQSEAEQEFPLAVAQIASTAALIVPLEQRFGIVSGLPEEGNWGSIVPMNEPNMLPQLLAIAAGGSVGAMCRHVVNLVCSRWFGGHLALGTLAVNVAGCFFIGLLIALRTTDSPRWDDLTHSALTIGFLGAFTTFSTFGFETTRFFENAQHSLGFLNIAGNMLLGLSAVFGGLQLGRLMVS